MNKIDFSPLKGTIDGMAMKLAVILFVPLLTGLICKYLLRSLKVPNNFSNGLSIALMLFVFYQTILKVIG
ncbi:hypothetical protein ACFFHF_12980 [Robertmurraya beringensis]|uniref:Uncharacterized protein n=1 Tax=Robertmurraya beringensis TaxID=641660 RepID=A0ABV6KT28_9BACI